MRGRLCEVRGGQKFQIIPVRTLFPNPHFSTPPRTHPITISWGNYLFYVVVVFFPPFQPPLVRNTLLFIKPIFTLCFHTQYLAWILDQPWEIPQHAPHWLKLAPTNWVSLRRSRGLLFLQKKIWHEQSRLHKSVQMMTQWAVVAAAAARIICHTIPASIERSKERGRRVVWPRVLGVVLLCRGIIFGGNRTGLDWIVGCGLIWELFSLKFN